MPSFNGLVAYASQGDFWERRATKEVSFLQDWTAPIEKQQQLYGYAQDDKFSQNYDAGNQAFAKGEAAMLMQGSWAIPVIRGFKPDFDIGIFPSPADTAADTVIASGVDVGLTMGKDPAHPEEAMKFIEFLMEPENVKAYVEAQSAVPTVADLQASDPALKTLTPYNEQEKVTGFVDHHIPAPVSLDAYTQQALIDKNVTGYLQTLDTEWDKVAKRRPVEN